MARLDKVANRYAKAIFDSQQKGLKEVVEELSRFAEVIEANKELQHIFATAIFTEDQRVAIVEDLVAKLKISAESRRVLLVLASMKRLASLALIVDKVKRLMLTSTQIVPLRVEAAASLSAEQKEKIETRFTKLLGKKVEANYVADSALIGGLRVTAEGRTFDGSLSGWLSSFEEQLSEGVAV